MTETATTLDLPVNGLEIWPERLKELSAAGPGKLDDEGFAILKAFSDEHFHPDADVVIEYEADFGSVFPKVYRRFESTWTALDADDGADHVFPLKWEDLAVVMVRDRKPNMVVANIAQTDPATAEKLRDARRGTVITAGDGQPGHPELLVRLSENLWVDLYEGIDSSYTIAQLIEFFPKLGVVWYAPGVDDED